MTALARLGPSRRRSDAELLAGIATGDLGALGELYDRYHADIRRMLDRVTANAPDVDDLVQATFLELPRIAGSFDGRESARGWLAGIAARLASRQRRSLARFVRTLASYAHVADVASARDPEAMAGAREDLRLFERALRDLDARSREAFVLVEIEGLVIEEVARGLGIPAPTLRTRLFTARGKLREAMKGARS